jgi:hypothetical protein
MADPISPAAASYTPPPYDPTIGDYSSYKPLAKTAWSQDGSDEHGLTFSDFLDVINPLQHLPIISTIYRAITGDKIGMAAKLAGDTLYGGPIGFLASGVTAAFEGIAGESTSDMVADAAHAIFGGSSSGDDAQPATEEARAHESEQTHEAELAGLAQMAMVPVAPAAPTADATPKPPAAKPAIASVAAARSSDAKGGDETTQRIAKALAEARRAQASMLLASLQEAPAAPREFKPEAARRDNAAPAIGPSDAKPDPAPARAAAPTAPTADAPAPNAVATPAANPYLPPERGAASWSSETLAETLARYERAVAANRR